MAVAAYNRLVNLCRDGNVSLITQELCNEAIQCDDGENNLLKLIPEQFKTREICEKCLGKKPELYRLVPKELMDQEMWEYIFELNGYIIRNGDIPNEILTQEMYEIAVMEGRLDPHYVPHEFKNKAICEYIIKMRPLPFNQIPAEIMDREMLIEAVKYHGYFIREGNIPDDMRDQEIYEIAVIDGELHICHVPHVFRNKTICLYALNQCKNDYDNEDVFLFIPTNIVDDPSLQCEFVSANGNFLSQIQDKDKTIDVCRAAIKQTRDAVRYLPKESEGLIPLIVELIGEDKYGEIFTLLPEYYRQPIVCRKVLEVNGVDLTTIPEDRIDYDTCMVAYRNNRNASDLVPIYILDRHNNDHGADSDNRETPLLIDDHY